MNMKLLVFFPLLISGIAFCQADNTSGIPIPMKNGKVFYEKEYSLTINASKAQLFEKTVKWFATSFTELNEPLLVQDSATGKIAGHGIFKIVVSASGNYYWMKPVISVTVADGRYIFQAYDFYEKPIEKGISNEYSKIEYRWRDFRKGKPWSAEDEPLFKGINASTLSLMSSLEQSLSK